MRYLETINNVIQLFPFYLPILPSHRLDPHCTTSTVVNPPYQIHRIKSTTTSLVLLREKGTENENIPETRKENIQSL